MLQNINSLYFCHKKNNINIYMKLFRLVIFITSNVNPHYSFECVNLRVVLNLPGNTISSYFREKRLVGLVGIYTMHLTLV